MNNTAKAKHNFFSAGKLMLSGEYAVKYGARSLVLPLKEGQEMFVSQKPAESKAVLEWISEDSHETWFRAIFTLNELNIRETNDQEAAEFVRKLLQSAMVLNHSFLKGQKESLMVLVRNNFRRSWGWGSSSALISNIAWWAETDAFNLHRMVSGGSGYDVVAARSRSPFLFRVNRDSFTMQQAELRYAFTDHMMFFYQGRKQDSESAIQAFVNAVPKDEKLVQEISGISDRLAQCSDLMEFMRLLEQHERLTGLLTRQKTVQELHHPDFNGVVKSLGAWGGDFALMVSREGQDYIQKYLEHKNLTTSFKWEDIIL